MGRPKRNKTSVYLSEGEQRVLQQLAEETGMSQATVLREALAAYRAGRPGRDFALVGAFEGLALGAPPADSGRDTYQEYVEAMMRGFGDDSLGEYRPGKRT